MRLLISNHLSNALESLRSTRTRSALTMLGITIGVASITLILSLSSGAISVINHQIDALGGNIAVIRPGAISSLDQIDNITTPTNNGYATSTLTEQDINSIRSLPNIRAVAPLMYITGTVKNGNTVPKNASILATTPDLMAITNFTMAQGQFIDPEVNQDTAVIGSQLAIDLFGTDQAIGHTVTVNNKSLTIIGVLKPLNVPINYNNVDFDHTIIINFDSGKALNQGAAQIAQIDIKAPSAHNLAGVVTSIKSTLKHAHNDNTDTTVLSGSDISRPSSQLYYAIAGTLTAVATISLIVGGVGIMNIMLVSVTERTREIGIRKALGASNGQIIAQFLIESLALSIGGGVCGYVIGYLVGFAISRTFLTFDPLFSWQVAVIAWGVSVFIGTIFGLYPAIRASRRDPIEALRQYH